MSQSFNNGIKIKELLTRYNANTLKLYSYSKHYSSQISFNERDLRQYHELDYKIQEYIFNFGKSAFISEDENSVFKKFVSYLDDDLNTIEAIKLLKKSLNTEKSLQTGIGKMVNILGLKY
jgi:cysteinyl-tRNA synthetase